MVTNAKQKLVDFLDRRAFSPVLRAQPGKFSDTDRETLADVKHCTKTEIERFSQYSSAQEVVTNFRRDLTSEPARRVHRKLKHLGLPTLNDVAHDFERLADALGVKR